MSFSKEGIPSKDPILSISYIPTNVSILNTVLFTILPLAVPQCSKIDCNMPQI